MKRLVSLIAVIGIVFNICGCKAWDALKERAIGNLEQTAQNVTQANAPEVTNDISIGIYDLDTFNPLVTASQTVKEAMQFVYEPLFALDFKQQAIPVLASSFVKSADGRSIDVTIKDNVIWHDGDVLDAYDVAYTVKQIKSGVTGYTNNLKNLADYRIIDDNVIRFTFAWSAPKLESLLTFPIVKYQTAMTIDSSYNPVGTGAFRFDGKISTDRYKMSAFDLYRDGRAKLDRVYIDVAPNAEAYVKMYSTGQFDVATSDVIDLGSYTPKGSVLLNKYVTNKICFLGCNNANERLSGKATRQALSKLVNREYIVSSVIYSRGEAVKVPINPSSDLYTEADSEFGINVDEAYSLLMSDGWESAVNGGFSRKINGKTQKLELEVLVNSENAERVKIAERIKTDFHLYGVSTKVLKLPYEQYIQRIQSGQYDLFVGEYKLDPTFDLTPLLSSSGNYFAYANEQIDTMIGHMGMTASDEDLKLLFEQLAGILKEDMPFIPIYYSVGSMMSSAKIKAIASPSCAMAYNEVSKWAVKQ